MTRCNKKIYIPMRFRFNYFAGCVIMHRGGGSDDILAHGRQEYTRTVKSTDR